MLALALPLHSLLCHDTNELEAYWDFRTSVERGDPRFRIDDDPLTDQCISIPYSSYDDLSEQGAGLMVFLILRRSLSLGPQPDASITLNAAYMQLWRLAESDRLESPPEGTLTLRIVQKLNGFPFTDIGSNIRSMSDILSFSHYNIHCPVLSYFLQYMASEYNDENLTRYRTHTRHPDHYLEGPPVTRAYSEIFQQIDRLPTTAPADILLLAHLFLPWGTSRRQE